MLNTLWKQKYVKPVEITWDMAMGLHDVTAIHVLLRGEYEEKKEKRMPRNPNFNALVEMSNAELDMIIKAQQDILFEIQRKKMEKVSRILFLQNKIEEARK